MSHPLSNLALRVVTALAILPVVLVLIWAPRLELGFAALVAFIAVTTTHEFLTLLRARGIPTHEPSAIVGAAALVTAAWWGADVAWLNVALMGALVLAGAANVLSGPPSAAGLCGAFAALVYPAWCPAHVVLLHHAERGPGLVMLLAVAVVLTDTAAYFTGRSIGRHPMAPVVSPKKTWEGAAGGLTFAILGALLVHWLDVRYGWAVFPDWSFGRYALSGAALSVVAQLSDLVKSTVKRDAGVKDSGQLLPGHGGALDRFDGFLFAAPVLYYMVMF
jgi:phosphatidate cytidylyltransferase